MNGLESYQWIEDQVKQYKTQHNIETDLWYRGEGQLYDKMLSSMIRNVIGINPDRLTLHPEQREGILEYENWIHDKFVEHITTTHPDGYTRQPLQGWDVVYYLQHYGMNTRFLDWTDTLAVSIFFAGTGAKEGQDARIWLLNPARFNELTRGINDIVSPSETYKQLISKNRFASASIPPAAISPNEPAFVNQRIYNQRGYFVFTGLEYICLREYISDLANKKGVEQDSFFTEIRVPYDIIKLALEYVSSKPLEINKKTLGLEEDDHLVNEYSFDAYTRSANYMSHKRTGFSMNSGRW